MTSAVERAGEILRRNCGGRLRERFPLAPLTTFRVGGPAALYLELDTRDDLVAVTRAVQETDIDVTMLGKGSNVLVSDLGYDGLVLKLGRGFRWSGRDGDILACGAAVPLPALSGVAASHSLTGLEFGIAIPGSVGGAVRMNAGAHGGSIADVFRDAEVWMIGEGAVRSLDAAQMGFSYRRTRLPVGSLVLGSRFDLAPGDRDAIKRRMAEAREWRRATQPLGEPNCGSVFKNPPGDHAARLVEAAGMKGVSVGAATVSPKHANFIVTRPGATAADVLALVDEVVAKVEERFGVALETEVQIVGRFE